MKDGPLQLTKREMQVALRSPLLWIALACAAVVLGLAGPFGTYGTLDPPARLAYWACVVVMTYLCGLAVTTYAGAVLFDGRHSPARDLTAGALAGPLVTALVWGLNRAVFPVGGIGVLELLVYATAVSAVGTATISLFARRLAHREPPLPDTNRTAGTTPKAEPPRPPLLDRLPVALRGRLLHLSMQDHYVEVVTDRGSQLVLMRMADAVAETRGVDGLQIHRSHWVARDAVVGRLRQGDRLSLRLCNGAELPVSRSRAAAVRGAGLG